MNDNSYEHDIFGWANEQSEFLRNRQFEQLDIEHLYDEVLSLGKSERRALESHLAIWLMHELKIRYQPSMHTRSWDLSIKNARCQFLRCLSQNPSLKPHMTEILESAYEMARWRALDETNLFEDDIPEQCIFSLEDLGI